MSGNERISAGSAAVRVRLDKWLWAARFFKTRTLATEAVAGGKVDVNDRRVKPSHHVCVGETLRIRRDPDRFQVVVTVLSERRGCAKEAALLYEETAESRRQREEQSYLRRLQSSMNPPAGRPTKQDRRRIVRFTQGDY